MKIKIRKGNGKLIGDVLHNGKAYTFEESDNTRSLFDRMQNNGIDTQTYKDTRKALKQGVGKFPVTAVLRENVVNEHGSTTTQIDGMIFLDVHSDEMQLVVIVYGVMHEFIVTPYDFEPDQNVTLAKALGKGKVSYYLDLGFDNGRRVGNSVKTYAANISKEATYNATNGTDYKVYPKTYSLVKR
ncbi:hypothetical protein [Vibrio lentus]|uniref:hypothetical protein n=1 Tax=Vibrio lentus TaxID=136468 RepID=UPI000C848EF0|nr:hypothetical protein [Vibrio lentus]PML06370.1 hypothetical protein BCT85_06210 [Vibrio lentus]